MEGTRKEAYSFLLSAAMLHLKWDLGRFWDGPSWWPPWRLIQHSWQTKKAAHRAVACHNLAIFLTQEMDGFCEDTFWREIESFLHQFPEEGWSDYRRMFERKLAGEEVIVVKPGG
jgi:hypothetical protein